MNTRMLPPPDIRLQTRTVNGRTYTGAPGQVFDVPDFDALPLSHNGWVAVAPSGPTSARPAGSGDVPCKAGPGTEFYDTTIAKLIIFDGATWRDPATGNAV